MKAKVIKNKVIALIMAMLMTVALLPAIALAAPSTSLDFNWSKMGISDGDAVTAIAGAQDKHGWGLIAAIAVGGDSDKVVCASADEEIATVEAGSQDSAGYWKFDVKGKKKGQTTVTVAAEDNPEVTKVFQINVVSDANISLDFDSGGPIATAVGASKGGLIAVKAVSNDDPPAEIDDTVTCVSADESIATVIDQKKKNKKGYWKFDVIGQKKGDTTITVTSNENPQVQEIVRVSVVDELVTVVAGETTKAFQIEEFNALATETIPAWSGRNHSFTYKEYGEAKGPTLETVLTAAGVDVATLADDQLIRFTPSDGVAYQGVFTVKEILRDARYYYPKSADLIEGNAATEEQMADAVQIPTILCAMDNSDGRLVFGQVYPNERSNSVSIKNMTTGGTIEVLDEKASALACDVKANKKSGSTILPGTELVFDSPKILTTDIYYTTDGTDPSRITALYNYRTKEMSDEPDGGLKNATITAPKTDGTFTVKFMQASYGSLDSDFVTFKYNVQKIAKGKTFKVSDSSYTVTKVATDKAKGTVTFAKAKNAKSVTVPKTVKLHDGKVYNVTVIGAKAFTGSKIRTATIGANVTTLKKYALKGSKAMTVVLKTKKLTKTKVKGCLSGSKVKTVSVKVGTTKVNKTYVTKYKKYFTKANAGRKVTVK